MESESGTEIADSGFLMIHEKPADSGSRIRIAIPGFFRIKIKKLGKDVIIAYCLFQLPIYLDYSPFSLLIIIVYLCRSRLKAMEAKGTGTKLFRAKKMLCLDCGKKYVDANALVQHMNQAHGMADFKITAANK